MATDSPLLRLFPSESSEEHTNLSQAWPNSGWAYPTPGVSALLFVFASKAACEAAKRETGTL